MLGYCQFEANCVDMHQHNNERYFASKKKVVVLLRSLKTFKIKLGAARNDDNKKLGS